ncbi:MAG: hypothetical protein JJV95_03325 [Sulfurospirillum sp.]|nr:hypothetical protein [Sulfurospirillum sp.]MBL0702999.1 hypothetical protein [Sulfurospirillum sp.]
MSRIKKRDILHIKRIVQTVALLLFVSVFITACTKSLEEDITNGLDTAHYTNAQKDFRALVLVITKNSSFNAETAKNLSNDIVKISATDDNPKNPSKYNFNNFYNDTKGAGQLKMGSLKTLTKVVISRDIKIDNSDNFAYITAKEDVFNKWNSDDLNSDAGKPFFRIFCNKN